jgi:hypothetical protein
MRMSISSILIIPNILGSITHQKNILNINQLRLAFQNAHTSLRFKSSGCFNELIPRLSCLTPNKS